jgi:hypothetical protein
MRDSTGLDFHECCVRKFAASYEEDELLTNLNRKNSKQSRVHKVCEELIHDHTNAIQMTLSKLEFQYTLLVPNWWLWISEI